MMITNKFDNLVKDMFFNPKLNMKILDFNPGNESYNVFGSNLISRNTFKVFVLIDEIYKILFSPSKHLSKNLYIDFGINMEQNYKPDPSEAIRWFTKKMGIMSNITEKLPETEPREIIDSISDYLWSDKDEETDAFWLFKDKHEQSKFLFKCKNIIKPSDILILCNEFGFDIYKTAELFAFSVFDEVDFYIKEPMDNFDENSSLYFRPVFAAIIYYHAVSHHLIPGFDYIKNNNNDNYK